MKHRSCLPPQSLAPTLEKHHVHSHRAANTLAVTQPNVPFPPPPQLPDPQDSPSPPRVRVPVTLPPSSPAPYSLTVPRHICHSHWTC